LPFGASLLTFGRRLQARTTHLWLISGARTGSISEVIPSQEPWEHVIALREVIATYLPSRHAKIEAAVEAAAMSVRSLQRRLASEGLTFSQLVDEVRLEMAVPQLRASDIRLTDIALSLGYSDPAHFTRAFSRWAGVSPSEYRAHQLMS